MTECTADPAYLSLFEPVEIIEYLQHQQVQPLLRRNFNEIFQVELFPILIVGLHLLFLHFPVVLDHVRLDFLLANVALGLGQLYLVRHKYFILGCFVVVLSYFVEHFH